MDAEKSQNQLALFGGLAEAELTKELIASDDFVGKYKILISTIEALTALKSTVDAKIKSVAEKHYFETGEPSIASNGYRYTYTPETTRESLNTKAFKTDHPDIYKEYVRVSIVSPSLRVTKTASSPAAAAASDREKGE